MKTLVVFLAVAFVSPVFSQNLQEMEEDILAIRNILESEQSLRSQIRRREAAAARAEIAEIDAELARRAQARECAAMVKEWKVENPKLAAMGVEPIVTVGLVPTIHSNGVAAVPCYSITLPAYLKSPEAAILLWELRNSEFAVAGIKPEIEETGEGYRGITPSNAEESLVQWRIARALGKKTGP